MDQVVAPSPPSVAGVSSVAAPLRHYRRWQIGVAVVLVLLAAAIGAWRVMRGDSDVRYATMPISRGAVTRTVTATGTVNPVLTIIVGSYVSGVIQQLFCDYNTPVKQGQVCAKIDPRPYQTVVDQDQANLEVARAQLEKDKANVVYAQVNYERNKQLAAREYVSQDAADVAKSQLDQGVAQVELDQATIVLRQAELDAAKVNLGYTDIVSPVDGIVVSRAVTMGQTVAATLQTPTLFLIATDLTKMEVDTNVSESDIGPVKETNASTFSVDAWPGRVFNGSVVQVRQSPQTVQNVVTYDVVVGVDNADLALKPGMTASTQIVTDQRSNVLRVPDQALRYTPSGSAQSATPRIWVLRGGKPVAVPVVLGLDDDSFSEIVSGDVKQGDQVVTGEQRGAAHGGVPAPRL